MLFTRRNILVFFLMFRFLYCSVKNAIICPFNAFSFYSTTYAWHVTSQLHGTYVVYLKKFRCSRISSSQMSIYFRSSRCSRNSVDILHIHSYEIYFNVIFSSTFLFHDGLFHWDSSTKIPLSIACLSHRYDMLHAYQPLKHSFITLAVSNCPHAITLVFFCVYLHWSDTVTESLCTPAHFECSLGLSRCFYLRYRSKHELHTKP